MAVYPFKCPDCSYTETLLCPIKEYEEAKKYMICEVCFSKRTVSLVRDYSKSNFDFRM